MSQGLSFLTSAGLVALSAALVTLSFAPYGQFYLAWVGVAPLLVVALCARSWVRAFGWGWAGGVIFFTVSMVWLFRATVPGTIALMMYLALFWGLAAALVRAVAPRAWAAVPMIPAIWVATEWLRATLFTGLPWILLGQSQSPVVVMAQVADFAGVYGVAFWVVAVNAAIAVAILHRSDRRIVAGAGATLALVLAFTLGYGIFRLSQDTLYPGPRVTVVQPSFLHERGGAKLVTQEQQISFHFGVTESALANDSTDLIVWSETVMPPLNAEVREELRNESSGRFLAEINQRLCDFAARHRATLVAGAYFAGGWRPVDGKRTATDIRNAVYVYRPDGTQDPSRYDKIHLVPYGEYLPFERTFPPLYRFFKRFAAYSVDYSINWASPDAMTVFTIDPQVGDEVWTEPARFVTPICFEDIVGPLLSRMFRPGDDGRKRADFIVNVTNDGWFLGTMQAQHLQNAIFRSIETRAPTARASNTGISGFIDSSGRTRDDWLVPVRSEGILTHRIALDRRIAAYSVVGDLFAYASVAIVGAALAVTIIRGYSESAADC